ncbi:hypothetical protein PUN28_003767 [Cardiocondyla obscurior]|uniref:Uncharacterized protein n=1 Tax=Cardiocondyla obscurior TaxID=286306 RepID=A0AAW2GM14_9HYME
MSQLNKCVTGCPRASRSGSAFERITEIRERTRSRRSVSGPNHARPRRLGIPLLGAGVPQEVPEKEDKTGPSSDLELSSDQIQRDSTTSFRSAAAPSDPNTSRNRAREATYGKTTSRDRRNKHRVPPASRRVATKRRAYSTKTKRSRRCYK